MAYVRSFWLPWGTLCSLLLSLFAQDTSWECRSKDDLLTEMSRDVNLPSACMLHCTARTYARVLETQDRLTVRFRESHAEKAEEYCWSTQVQCSPSQRLRSAFVVLPVDTAVEDRASVGVEVSWDASTLTLPRHLGRSPLPSACGLRFDVTELLVRKERPAVVCVRVVPKQPSVLRGGLRCPPFLATTWKPWLQGEG